MKSYIYLFPLFVLIISCNGENQNKLQGNSDFKLDSIYSNLDSSSFKSLLEKANFYDKYFAAAPTSTDTIDDEVARLMVKRDLRWFSGGIDESKVRSVFFDMKQLHNILATVRALKYDTLGMRIYFAKYDSQDPEVLNYLQKKYNCGTCQDYSGKRTLILQFMNKTNERYIYLDPEKH